MPRLDPHLTSMDSHTRPALSSDLGGLSHDLHNILTVLFGIADDLQGNESEVALQNTPLLQASISKIEEIARAMASLRSRMIDGSTVQPRAIATALVQATQVPQLGSMFGETARLQAEPSLVERLILAVAIVASHSGGLREVTPLHVPESGNRGHDVRLGLQFAEAVSDAGASLITSAVRDLGGTVHRDDSSFQCDLVGTLEDSAAAD